MKFPNCLLESNSEFGLNDTIGNNVLDFVKYINYYYNIITFFIDPEGTIDLDKKILNNRDLVIPKFSLSESKLLTVLKVTIKTNESNSNQYSTNGYMVRIGMKTNMLKVLYFINVFNVKCFLRIIVEKLHAEIVGNPSKQVSNSELVTLNASLSYNPNEPKSRQDDMVYIWNCDVTADKDNCQEYITTSKIFALINISRWNIMKNIYFRSYTKT